MLVEDQYTKATLEWCNYHRERKELDPLKDLPLGNRNDPGSCPCGAATGLYVGNHRAKERDPKADREDQEYYTMPVLVIEFVHRFDKGQYREYDLHPPFDPYG